MSFSSQSYGAQRVIRIVLTGDSSGLIRAFNAASAASAGTQTKLERMRNVGAAVSSVGSAMLRLSLPILGVGAYALKSASDFGKGMMLMRTQVGLTQAQTGALSNQIMSMAGKVGQSPAELAAAMYPLMSVGLRNKQAYDALRVAAEGADVSGASLADTANAVAGAMKTQMRDVHSAADAMAIMNETAVKGKMHLQDLVGAMATGILPEAKRFGLGFRDIGTALASMTREGIPAESAAARMRLVLTKMASPTGQTLKAFESIGLAQDTLAQDMRTKGLLPALEDLRAHMQALGPDAQNVMLAQAFGGSRSSSTIAAMLNAIPSMRQIAPAESAADAGQLQSGMQVWQKTIAGHFARAIASIKVSMIELGNAIAPAVEHWLPKIVSAITATIKFFSHLPGPVKSAAVAFTLFLAIGGPILIFLGSVVTAIGVIIPVLGTVVGALAGAASAFFGWAAGVAIDMGLADAAVTLFGVDTLAAITLATGGLILVVAAIIAAVVLIVTHFHQVESVAKTVFGAVKKWIVGAFHEVKSVAVSVFDSIEKFIVGAFDKIKRAASDAFGFVKHVIHTIGSSSPLGIPGQLASGNLGGALHAATFGLLAGGGPVEARHMQFGGPVGTDTVPGWLTPGEFVMSNAMTNQIGAAGMAQLGAGNIQGLSEALARRYGTGGAGGQQITIVPGTVNLKLDARTIARAVVEYTLQRAARGPSSLVGGSLMTGVAGSAA